MRSTTTASPCQFPYPEQRHVHRRESSRAGLQLDHRGSGHRGILRPKQQSHRLGALELVWYLEYALSPRPAYFDRIGFHPYQWDQQTTAAGCLNLTYNWGG
jgi:hypothetical protein